MSDDSSSGFWDEKFSGDDSRYGKQPNAFLKHRESLLPPRGRVLVIGDGEGRNGVFLAKMHHDVVTIDASRVAIDKARRLAEEAGVSVDTRFGKLPDVDLEEGSFDAVVSIYVHLEPERRAATHRLIARALKPGGVLLLEGFNKAQLDYESGGPKDPELLYDAEMLRSDFDDLVIEGISEVVTVLDEGPGHRGEASVIRLIATKD